MKSNVAWAFDLVCKELYASNMAAGAALVGSLLLHEKLGQMSIASEVIDGYADHAAGPRPGKDPRTGRAAHIFERTPWSTHTMWVRVGDDVYDVMTATQRMHGVFVDTTLVATPSHRISDNGRVRWRHLYDSGRYWRDAPDVILRLRQKVMQQERKQAKKQGARDRKTAAAAAQAKAAEVCEGCRKTEAELGAPLRRCSCLTAMFCGEACQLQAWKAHKKECKAARGL